MPGFFCDPYFGESSFFPKFWTVATVSEPRIILEGLSDSLTLIGHHTIYYKVSQYALSNDSKNGMKEFNQAVRLLLSHD